MITCCRPHKCILCSLNWICFELFGQNFVIGCWNRWHLFPQYSILFPSLVIPAWIMNRIEIELTWLVWLLPIPTIRQCNVGWNEFWGSILIFLHLCHHSSLVDYLAQVIYAKNCPTIFYCICQLVWVPMTTMQNIKVCFWSFYKTLFS